MIFDGQPHVLNRRGVRGPAADGCQRVQVKIQCLVGFTRGANNGMARRLLDTDAKVIGDVELGAGASGN